MHECSCRKACLTETRLRSNEDSLSLRVRHHQSVFSLQTQTSPVAHSAYNLMNSIFWAIIGQLDHSLNIIKPQRANLHCDLINGALWFDKYDASNGYSHAVIINIQWKWQINTFRVQKLKMPLSWHWMINHILHYYNYMHEHHITGNYSTYVHRFDSHDWILTKYGQDDCNNQLCHQANVNSHVSFMWSPPSSGFSRMHRVLITNFYPQVRSRHDYKDYEENLQKAAKQWRCTMYTITRRNASKRVPMTRYSKAPCADGHTHVEREWPTEKNQYRRIWSACMCAVMLQLRGRPAPAKNRRISVYSIHAQ